MIEPMQLEDIPAVMDVERKSFSMPWPSQAYRRELKDNRLARYIVARRTGGGSGPTPSAAQEREGEDLLRPNGWRNFLDRLMGALAGPASEEEPTGDVRSRRVAGYAGLWLMVDEAHITSIAVDPAYRGLGVGDLLMIGLVDIARQVGAQYLTLEVRVSNTVAQSLYRKFLFKDTGVRRKYYTDNNEDALIMWSDPLTSPGFLQMVEEQRRALVERLRSPRTLAELRARSVSA